MKNKVIEEITKELKGSDAYLCITEKGTHVYGNEPEICTMISLMIHGLIEHGVDKEHLKYATNTGFMNEEEMEKETKEKIKKMMEKLGELFDE